MNYCPKWIYEIACANVAAMFLQKQTDLLSVAKAHQACLDQFYTSVPVEELTVVAEGIVRFLDELDAGEAAVDLLFGFCHHRVKFEAPNKPRKLKGFLGSADDGVKVKEQSPDDAVKAFRAYVYALRNGVAETAPVGWSLASVVESDVIKGLGELVVDPLDFL
jgi:hypothetical protein